MMINIINKYDDGNNWGHYLAADEIMDDRRHDLEAEGRFLRGSRKMKQ